MEPLFADQPFSRHFERTRDEAELALALFLIVLDVEGPVLENPLRGSAGPLPVLEHSDLARDKIEPFRIEFQERCLLYIIARYLLGGSGLQFRTPGFALLAFQALPAGQKTTHMDKSAATLQPENRPSEHRRIRHRLALDPGQLEKIVGAQGAIAGIDDWPGQHLDLATERELDEVGNSWSGRGETERRGAAPFGKTKTTVAISVPNGGQITVMGRKFAFDPCTMIAAPCAASRQNRSGIAPVEVVNRRR